MAQDLEIILSDINGLTLKTKNTIIKNNIVIKMDEESLANLIPENIAKGIIVMGIEGTWEGYGSKVPFTLSFCGYEWNDENSDYSFNDNLLVSGSYWIGSAEMQTFSNVSTLTLNPREGEKVILSINNYDYSMAPGVISSGNCSYSDTFIFTNFTNPAFAKIQINDV